jgi:hypothetical protein
MIVTEVRMKTTATRPAWEIDALNAETQNRQYPPINVRQAAQMLGVSKSTIYRTDREHGPFRFVLDGRRIFIDFASFENYLATITGSRSSALRESEQSIRTEQQLAAGADTESPVTEPTIETCETTKSTTSIPASRSSGQRELFPRASPNFCVITYQSFMP